jgi:hypothetical protein
LLRSACALRHSGVTGESESEDDDHVFKKFTLAAYALEKANDQTAEISMRLKQLKRFLQFFCIVFQSVQNQHYHKT